MKHKFYYSEEQKSTVLLNQEALNKVFINNEWHEYSEMRDGDSKSGDKSDWDNFKLLGEARCSDIKSPGGYRYKDCSRCKSEEAAHAG